MYYFRYYFKVVRKSRSVSGVICSRHVGIGEKKGKKKGRKKKRGNKKTRAYR